MNIIIFLKGFKFIFEILFKNSKILLIIILGMNLFNIIIYNLF